MWHMSCPLFACYSGYTWCYYLGLFCFGATSDFSDHRLRSRPVSKVTTMFDTTSLRTPKMRNVKTELLGIRYANYRAFRNHCTQVITLFDWFKAFGHCSWGAFGPCSWGLVKNFRQENVNIRIFNILFCCFWGGGRRGIFPQGDKWQTDLAWIGCWRDSRLEMFKCCLHPLELLPASLLALSGPSTGWMLYYVCFCPSTARGSPLR